MWFSSNILSNFGTFYDGPCEGCNDQNSKYSDFLKQYAIDVFKAAMESPHGSTTSRLTSDNAEPYRMNKLQPKTTFMGKLKSMKNRTYRVS